jgi:hypothetical protein
MQKSPLLIGTHAARSGGLHTIAGQAMVGMQPAAFHCV